MLVRPAERSDVATLATIWHAGWQDAHAGILPAALAQRRTLDSFSRRLHAALPDLRVVGPPLPAPPVGFCLVRGAELCQLYVASAARGSGAAAALIRDAESRLRDAGIATAWLACAVGNERAARFYEKAGWRRIGTVPHEPDDSGGIVFDVWRYEKRLRPGAEPADRPDAPASADAHRR
jgi:ribosomal protein S18 acetylase RimI-like enzyme